MSIDFGELKERALDLAQTGVAKAKEFTDVAIGKGKQITEVGKLKVQNASEQEAAKKAYLELGKLYYAQHGDAPDPDYAGLCSTIAAALSRVEYNNERIADIKAAGGLSDEDIADAACDCCECADEPEAPEVPEVPETPSVPETPETPKAPDSESL